MGSGWQPDPRAEAAAPCSTLGLRPPHAPSSLPFPPFTPHPPHHITPAPLTQLAHWTLLSAQPITTSCSTLQTNPLTRQTGQNITADRYLNIGARDAQYPLFVDSIAVSVFEVILV